ncbi:hypothetical protein CCR96_21200 [Halochromatium roseum]|nr:hypothetical protein [Halochromatium roseum]
MLMVFRMNIVDRLMGRSVRSPGVGGYRLIRSDDQLTLRCETKKLMDTFFAQSISRSHLLLVSFLMTSTPSITLSRSKHCYRLLTAFGTGPNCAYIFSNCAHRMRSSLSAAVQFLCPALAQGGHPHG